MTKIKRVMHEVLFRVVVTICVPFRVLGGIARIVALGVALIMVRATKDVFIELYFYGVAMRRGPDLD